MAIDPPVHVVHPLACDPAIHGDDYYFVGGPQTTALQLGVRLERRGWKACLSTERAETGLVVQHWDTHRRTWPGTKQYLVVTRNDRWWTPFANAEVVQNASQAGQTCGHPRFYVPIYPQQGLVPRDPARADKFKTLVYHGRAENLHPDLVSPGFIAWLKERELCFKVCTDPSDWSDYSDVDAVVAVRDYDKPFHNKPFTKLVNAWRAGVPAILGPESAFQSLRREETDYFEVRSLDDIKQALEALRTQTQNVVVHSSLRVSERRPYRGIGRKVNDMHRLILDQVGFSRPVRGVIAKVARYRRKAGLRL